MAVKQGGGSERPAQCNAGPANQKDPTAGGGDDRGTGAVRTQTRGSGGWVSQSEGRGHGCGKARWGGASSIIYPDLALNQEVLTKF